MQLRPGSPVRFSGFSIACLIFLLLAAVAGVPESLAASNAPNVVFILDASGSMGAKIQGKVKMDAAKEALSGLIRDLPAGINMGLVVYGHRQKADCEDVEELFPLGPQNKDAVTRKIKEITPKGKTPITYSVRKVAEGLKTLEDEATIVLVSDGEETCNADPCAAVKELKDSGIKFVMHVIGFDVAEKEKAQLACMAQAGGGMYLAAKNAGELSIAAKKALAKTEESGAKLKVNALRNGKPLRAYCEVYKSGSEESDKRVTEGWIEAEGTTFKLLPGTYDIVVQNNDDAGKPVIKFPGTALETGKVVSKTADFSGGGLKVKALRNGQPFRAYCEIYKPKGGEDGRKERVTDGWVELEGTSFKLQPGTYDVSVQNNDDAGKPTVNFSAVAVEAGKTVEKVADFSGGGLKVKALRNGQPFRAYCEIYKPKGGEDGRKERVTDGWVELEGTSFKLQPGTYDVSVQNNDDAGKPTVSFSGVTVEAGKAVEKVADFSGGGLKVKALRNGQPFRAYCEIYKPQGGEDGEKERVTDGWVELEGTSFKLQPGTYDVSVQNNDDAGKPTVNFSAVAVEAGKSVEKTAEFSGGTLRVKALRNGKPTRAYCEIYKGEKNEDQESERVNDGWVEIEGTAFKLVPGTYDVKIQNQDDIDKPVVSFAGTVVEAGKGVEKTAEFAGGSIRIKAVKNGKPFRVYCEISKAGEDGDSEGVKLDGSWIEGEGHTFKVSPGEYDLIIEKSDSNEGKEFRKIKVEANKAESLEAQF